MQLNRVGIWLIAFFGLVGLAFVVVPLLVGADGQIVAILGLLGAIWVLVAGGLVLYARGQGRKAAHQDEIFRTGIRGTATVLSAGSSMTVNEMPLMKLRLELAAPGMGTRQASRREVMPVFAANRMAPGLVLPAYFDPTDPGDFVLVW
ncbi:MAG: hypothetical protein JST59_08310 [Actinobacteria bacterium]|nr:hypothetical protein [Actinomycetota bacterium]